MGVIFSLSQSFGNVPSFKDGVKITCKIGDISVAHDLRTKVGIPSGPADLLGSNIAWSHEENFCVISCAIFCSIKIVNLMKL